MRNLALQFPSWLMVLNGLLVLTYVALMAIVMSYAALQVEFAQSVRSDEATVAALESSYLAELSAITSTDYSALGYTKPTEKAFVAGSGSTALLIR